MFHNLKMHDRDIVLSAHFECKAAAEAAIKNGSEQPVNLVAGMVYDETGKLRAFKSVKIALLHVAQEVVDFDYQTVNGPEDFSQAVQKLIFGQLHEEVCTARKSAETVQTHGGTGALSLAYELAMLTGCPSIAIPAPTWDVHKGIAVRLNFPIVEYPLYDSKKGKFDFVGMKAALKALPRGSAVVIHTSCQNPTGKAVKLSQARKLVELCKLNDLLPILDQAYLGFGGSDTMWIEELLRQRVPYILCTSFSKAMAAYSLRVGALTVVEPETKLLGTILNNLVHIGRHNVSTSASIPAAVVTKVLTTPTLKKEWLSERAQAVKFIKTMRVRFVEELNKAGVSGYDYLVKDEGLFSYLNLSPEQVSKLKGLGIFLVPTSRICVSAINEGNVARVAAAIAEVLKS